MTTVLEDHAYDISSSLYNHGDSLQKTTRLPATLDTISSEIRRKPARGMPQQMTPCQEMTNPRWMYKIISILTARWKLVATVKERKICESTKLWESATLTTQPKIRIFKSNILSILLCVSVCWTTTNSKEQKLDIFRYKCLRHILRIFWPNIISHEDFLNTIGVTIIHKLDEEGLDMQPSSTPSVALRRKPQAFGDEDDVSKLGGGPTQTNWIIGS